MKSDIKIYETLSPEETLEVGRELGKASMAGQVYALAGDLGSARLFLQRDSRKDWASKKR